MRPSLLLTLGSVLIPALAQNTSETFVIDQCADFNLVIQSHNKTLDGKLLGACHDGAVHEGLCIVDNSFNFTSSYVNFQFNTTRGICTETNSTGTFTIPCSNNPVDPTFQSGTLTWWLDFTGESGPDRISQAMLLEFQPWSNVALAQISFDNYWSRTFVAFDKQDLLNILVSQDDMLEPGFEYLQNPKALYRWYICQTYYTEYHYTALTWVMGTHSPQNPTCEKVDVKRVFV